MSPQAAECVKLFSNAYLAMRVAYFNELDSFCMLKDINAKEVVEGVSDDLRIGQYYNNPSFGYGGYCLPKDTKHLLESFLDIPQELIAAIVNSNVTRKNLLSQEILRSNPSNVGIYRLAMKAGSDNYRDSAVLDIIDVLLDNKVNVFVYDPELKLQNLERVSLISDLEEFISKSDLILANRFEKNLSNCREKVFTRDIFGTDD
jgi:UDPglucose 6-dehydrogenase